MAIHKISVPVDAASKNVLEAGKKVRIALPVGSVANAHGRVETIEYTNVATQQSKPPPTIILYEEDVG
jgi:hypothetical protein